MSQKLLPGSQDTQEQWSRGEKDHRTHQDKLLKLAYREGHKGKLNFGAYLEGRDHRFLGLIPTQPRPTYYGRAFGNDSSNVQSILNGPAYWRRVYYRPEDPYGEALKGIDSPKAASAPNNSRPGSGSAGSRPGSRGGGSKDGRPASAQSLGRPASAGSFGRPSSSGGSSSMWSSYSESGSGSGGRPRSASSFPGAGPRRGAAPRQNHGGTGAAEMLVLEGARPCTMCSDPEQKRQEGSTVQPLDGVGEEDLDLSPATVRTEPTPGSAGGIIGGETKQKLVRPSSAPMARSGSAPALQGGPAQALRKRRRPGSAAPKGSLRKPPVPPGTPSEKQSIASVAYQPPPSSGGGSLRRRPQSANSAASSQFSTTAPALPASRGPEKVAVDAAVGSPLTPASSAAHISPGGEGGGCAPQGGGGGLTTPAVLPPDLSGVPESQRTVLGDLTNRSGASKTSENKKNPKKTAAEEEEEQPAAVPAPHLGITIESFAGTRLEEVSGYTKIKASMEPYVLYGDKPHVNMRSRGDRATFFNTLDRKYGVTWGGDRHVFDFDKYGHRSSRSELTYIASQGLRKDWCTVLIEPGQRVPITV